MLLKKLLFKKNIICRPQKVQWRPYTKDFFFFFQNKTASLKLTLKVRWERPPTNSRREGGRRREDNGESTKSEVKIGSATSELTVSECELSFSFQPSFPWGI